MGTYQALYYPFIHFKDDKWIKLAALYWDKVGRIVPEEYKTHDSETVKALGTFVKTLRPDSARLEFRKSFVDFIARFGPKLREKYALSQRESWPIIKEAHRPPRAGGASGTDPRLGYIYYEKIGDELYSAMNESGLASTDFRGDRWIGMHPDLAWVYMSALAEHISDEHGLRPLTDETRNHLALSELSNERLAHALLEDVSLVDEKPTTTEVETILVSVAFQAVVPKELERLSIDKILAFRDKYPDERAKFQSTAANFIADSKWLESITDPQVLEERLKEEYAKIWAPKVTELRDSLSEVGIDTIFSCFNLKAALPTGIAAGAAALSLTLNPIAAGTAGLALGAIPSLRDKRKAARKTLKESTVSFLYKMEQDLKPIDLWGKVKNRALQFALGI